jgi:endoglucanase
MRTFRWSMFALLLSLLVGPHSVFAYAVTGGRIVDAQGQAVQLRGVNWFGFETTDHVVHGLWARNWKSMIDQMRALDINAVRLPVCPGTLRGSMPGTINYDLNPDLAGLDSLGLLDAVVQYLDAQGLYILLDHHRPDCQSISELWYTAQYSEQQWIADLSFLAQRYGARPHVIGVDLKNEPHGAATWGTGNLATDWNKAAERAAAAVGGVAPHWLIFVEGIQENPSCSANDHPFWGENLEPLSCTPLSIPADRVVLSPHTYGPDVFVQPYFNDPTFPDNMAAIWDRHFGQFIDSGHAVIIGEFGGKYGEGDPRDVQWQDALVDYLLRKGVGSAFYWAWNPNSDDTGGILDDDWITLREDKLTLLKRLWAGPSAPHPEITAAPLSLSFGDMSVGSVSAVQTSTIRNAGTADLVLGTITISGTNPDQFRKPAARDFCSGQTLVPTQTCTVGVRFKPKNGGPQNATLLIPSNDPVSNPITVTLDGTGDGPEITVDPTAFDYGPMIVGTKSPRKVSVRNDGTTDLMLGIITLDGTNPDQFRKPAGKDFCSGQTLAPTQTCTVVVRFAPGNLGPQRALLVIPSNDFNENPVTVTLDGTGTAP